MTLYEKRGRRYYPVRETEQIYSFPSGYHMIAVTPGLLSIRYNVDPDNVRLLAAAHQKEESMRKVLNDALDMRPTRRPLTTKQKSAWDAFKEAMGNDGYIVEYESVNGLIDSIIEEMLK